MNPIGWMMYESIIDSLKESPIVERGGYHYFVHPLTNGIPSCDPKMLEEIVDWMKDEGNMHCDLILAPESMGIPYAVLLSAKTGIPYSIVRKVSFGFESEIELTQRTGYSKSSMYVNGVHEGMRIVIVDDVVSTGGTLNAIVDAVRSVGASVVDVLIAINKDNGVANVEPFGVSIKTLFDVTSTSDGVDVRLSSEAPSEDE